MSTVGARSKSTSTAGVRHRGPSSPEVVWEDLWGWGVWCTVYLCCTKGLRGSIRAPGAEDE